MADKELTTQFEAAIVMLRSAYNTAIRENRFIVGGAVEHILVGAFNGAGLPAEHVGVGDTRIDLRVHDANITAGFSSKASFSSYNTRLINTLGAGRASWTEPTLFLFAKVGIVYADPDLLTDAVIHTADALVIDGKKMKDYIATHPEYVIPMAFEKPKGGKIASSKTASEDVARNIVRNFPKLSLP